MMLSTFIAGYFYSLAEFWRAAIHIGLPHILLVILLVCWLRRRWRDGDSCCWSFGTRSADGCCANHCCQREADDGSAGDAGHEEAESRRDADHDEA